MCFVLYQTNAQESSQNCSKRYVDITDSLRIKTEDLPQYKEAYNYILSDSVNQRKRIFVSDVIVDMDRFYFKDYIKNDSTLTHLINSLTKYIWFDNFTSKEIQCLFANQDRDAESVLFFSLIEKNTLRVDLFFNRESKENFKYNRLSNYNVENIYAYLFFFDEAGKIQHVYRIEMIYEI